jgi:hypothetical protein
MTKSQLITLSLAPLARNNKPESEKFTHDQVGYEDPSTHPYDECKDCKHFIPQTDESPPGCEGVQRPIAEGAWCHRFERDTMKKHEFSHTVVEHHDDGSHTVHHIHKKHGHVHTAPKREGDVKGSAGDHDQMMDHMMDHTSMPNPGEGNDESNQPMGAAGAAAATPVTQGA